MRSRRYNQLSYYISFIITSLHYENLVQPHLNCLYKQFTNPVFRGGKVNLNDFKIGDIKFFPTFTSTSHKVSEAVKWVNKAKLSDQQKEEGYEGVITRIFLNGLNNPKSYIDCCTKDLSFYEEYEVLLLPFFQFQVMNIEDCTHEYKGVTKTWKMVTLVEMPFQDNLKMKEVKEEQKEGEPKQFVRKELYQTAVIWYSQEEQYFKAEKLELE